MSNITFYPGDERPNLFGVITFTGDPTLAGSTVTMTIKARGGGEAVSDAAVVTTIDDTAKTIDWSYDGATFTVIGTYDPYFTVTLADGDVKTIEGDKTIIVKQPYGS